MSRELEGRVCVVTGAARSIGLSLAKRYCEAGASVAMLDINPKVLEEADSLKASGFKVTGMKLDITDRLRVFECFNEIKQKLGPIYALINNAGIVDQRPFEEITPELMDKMMKVNVNGTLYCCQAAVDSMKSVREGKIINFSSKSGKTGSALMAHYSAAKGAVISLTHALAFELASYNINVNCVCPGITDFTGVWSEVSKGYVDNLKLSREEIIKKFTAKIPLGRLTDINDIVELVYFLTVQGNYCTGQAFNISGGREVH
jgi:NAD(P)-dependent dehydrogenase (short-subunit alcohol dehydrogenase family)